MHSIYHHQSATVLRPSCNGVPKYTTSSKKWIPLVEQEKFAWSLAHSTKEHKHIEKTNGGGMTCLYYLLKLVYKLTRIFIIYIYL